MNQISRRGWLLALAGTPVLLGVTAQALSVRLDNDFLHVSAPNLQFLTGKPLDRLMDGRTASFLALLTVATGAERTVQGKSAARFAFSYDIWKQRFKATLVAPAQTPPPS